MRRTSTVLEDLRALAYLDARRMANRLRLLLRDPKRLLPWLVLLAWLAFTRLLQFASRSGRSGRAPAAPRGSSPALANPLLALVALLPGVYLALLGIGLTRAAARAPATFRTAADARFLIGSQLSSRLVVGWLQLRRVVAMVLASLVNVLVLVAVTPSFSAPVPRPGVLLLAILGAFVTLQTLPMAAYLLKRRLGWLPLAPLGLVLTALGIGSALVAFLPIIGAPLPLPWWTKLVLVHLPPGQWLADAYHGQALAPVLMLLLGAAAIAVTVRLSGDCYPELWESSTRAMSLRRLALQRRGGWISMSDIRQTLGQARRRSAASSSGSWVPGGAWAILWKEWLSLRRSAALSLQLLLLGSAIAGGVIAGSLALFGQRAVVSALYSTAGTMLLIYNFYAGVQLGAELRSPVWWLSAASLKMRLLAWSVAGSLRVGVPACLGFGIALTLSGAYALVLPVLVVGVVAIWTMRMMAVASYAVFPAQLDVRGPGRVLRFLFLWAGVIPAGLALVALLITTGSLPAAISGMAIVLLGEGWLLLELSAWLVRRNGVAYVRAEAL